ncbi:hypothetical protein BGX16_2796 [Hallerella succinigenes]|uniref:Uncharacterized protein n=1 Tax=Hallerella succinigenes TaxID=1896222 RepID=A0A2M9AAK3_9BACT|nr:hypothetical protein BGX16_2796 [Hallerella succinigenes]
MKKIASLFFCVLTCSSFSLGQPLVGDLYFTSLKIDSVQMPKACEMYSSYFLSDSSSKKFNEDCSSDSEGIGFHSLLDSTVFIYFRGDEKRQYLDLARAFQNCVGPYPEDSTVGTPGTHQFSEVMMFELLRFQECGIINIQRDSLELLLVSAIAQIKAKNKKCPDLDWGSYGENSGAQWLFGPGCCSLVESPSAISNILKISRDIRAEKVSAGKFRLSGVPLGMDVSVFDLNGKLLLRKNFDGGFLEIPNVPAVVRVHGNWLWMK